MGPKYLTPRVSNIWPGHIAPLKPSFRWCQTASIVLPTLVGAVEAGRHVLVEKPAGRAPAEVQAIVRAANNYHVPLYPISTGNNWGYGSAQPARDDEGFARDPGRIVGSEENRRAGNFRWVSGSPPAL